MTNEETREHIDMLIAHKDKALETHPYFKRCDSCTHSEEQDGSNCYECVKGMADNFETQPKTSYISVDLNKWAKEVAEKALDEITYEGKTIREWAEIIVKQPSETIHGCTYGGVSWGGTYEPQQPCEDCISRQAVLDVITFEDKWLYDAKSHNADTHIAFSSLESRVKALPSVTPQKPKGKWIKVITNIDEWGETWHFKCSICGEKSNKGYRPLENYCHNCGAEMDGGAE